MPIKIRPLPALAAFLTAIALTGCGRREAAPAAGVAATSDYQETLMAALLDAKPGDVIELPEGTFSFDRSLSLAVDGVTIRGKGMEKTVLSFKGQVAGAEGLLVTASDFTAEDFAIEDTKGDALKVNEGENIVIRRVRTEWTGAPKTENGAYGIYPVQTTNVLLESNVAIGASDAGIYVGQSKNVIVRYNRAEKNVAGIEIENTFDADVYENVATDNTGGILVFNMPNLAQPGARTRVFKNEVIGNNRANFGHPGTPVATIPAGSGVVINSNDQVEIFDNDIRDNKTTNVIVSSIHSSGLSKDGMAADFDGYPEGVYIYGNRMGGGGTNPDGLDLQTLKIAKFGPLGALPDVLWDGFVNDSKLVGGSLPAALRLCVDNAGAEVINVDAPNRFKAPALVTEDVRCSHEKLPAVVLANGIGG